jgi:hypothetical protein
VKIKVGSKNYKVKFKDVIWIGDDIVNGKCDFAITELQVLKEVSRDQARSLLIHELTHAMIRECGANAFFENPESEELFVRSYSNMLTQTLRDNPDLLEELEDNLMKEIEEE